MSLFYCSVYKLKKLISIMTEVKAMQKESPGKTLSPTSDNQHESESHYVDLDQQPQYENP
jgi:hypothetical protein